MTTIMHMTAVLTLEKCLTAKNSGTPISAPMPKHMSCLFVRLKSTFVFTRVRSRGTGIYAAIVSGRECAAYFPAPSFLPLVRIEHSLRKRARLKEREAQQHGVAHNAPY